MPGAGRLTASEAPATVSAAEPEKEIRSGCREKTNATVRRSSEPPPTTSEPVSIVPVSAVSLPSTKVIDADAPNTFVVALISPV